jgi:hypothetical protein
MKIKYLFLIALLSLVIVFISNCNEEIIVDQKSNSKDSQVKSVVNPDNSVAQLVQKEDSTTKKERIAQLKKEHEEPFVVIVKPEVLLAEKLKARAANKSSVKTTKNNYHSIQNVQSCYTMEVETWALEKYHSKTGLNVGIWPKEDWMSNTTTLTTLKNFWAFNLIMLFRNKFTNPTVYPDNQIVGQVCFNYPHSVLNSYNNFLSDPTRQQLFGFYSDEPWHIINPYNRDSIALCINGLKSLGFTTSKYWAGETCDAWADNFDDLVDYVNHTSYTDMSYLPGYGCYRAPWDEADQRDEWTDFNNMFGSKFNHLWVSGESDRGEMDVLIGHAQNMSKNSIWLYAAESGMSNQSYWDAIAEFNYYAFVHCYLNREERKYIYVYNYIGSGDPCTDSQITS